MCANAYSIYETKYKYRYGEKNDIIFSDCVLKMFYILAEWRHAASQHAIDGGCSRFPRTSDDQSQEFGPLT